MTGIRLKSIIKIPANIVGEGGITVDNSGGMVTIGIDPAQIPSGFNWTGPWDSLTNYEINDGVGHEGASYIAIAANLNSEPPSADWDVMAQASSSPVVDDQVTPAMLDADTAPKTLLFHTRLGTVAYDNVQTLTEAQGLQARSNIYAAPFDAMAYNGMQINGSMDVSQEKGATASASGYILDGWYLTETGNQVLSATQSVNAPAGYSASLYVGNTTANASPGAGDHCTLYQHIEGYRVSRLAWGTVSAQSITLGFWVAATRTGTFTGSIRNGVTANRSCSFTYTINAVGTWEYKTVTIPGDVTGTWVKGNTAAMSINFSMLCGSTFATAPGVWMAGNFLGAPGQVNCCASTSDYFIITGVCVLPGIQAPTAAQSPLIMRPYDRELVTCQRYLNIRIGQILCVGAASAAAQRMDVITPWWGGAMRADPTMTYSSLVHNNTSALTDNASDSMEWKRFLTSVSAGVAFVQGTVVADARL
jgi:hypothetical protein